MISYTVIKPCYEIPLQLIIPLLSKLWRRFSNRRTLKKLEKQEGVEMAAAAERNATKGQLEAFHEVIEAEEAMNPFGGTFGEYNTKVIQYGYVAMFSSAFPLCALTSAVANFIELKSDAAKVSWQVRRPQYMGASHAQPHSSPRSSLCRGRCGGRGTWAPRTSAAGRA